MSDDNASGVSPTQRHNLRELAQLVEEHQIDAGKIRRSAYSEFRKASFSDLTSLRAVLYDKLEEAKDDLKDAFRENVFAIPVGNKSDRQALIDFHSSKERLAYAEAVEPLRALRQRVEIRLEVVEDVIDQRAIYGSLQHERSKSEGMRDRRKGHGIAVLEDAKAAGETLSSARELLRRIEIREGIYEDGDTMYQYFYKHFQRKGKSMPKGVEGWAEYFAKSKEIDPDSLL